MDIKKKATGFWLRNCDDTSAETPEPAEPRNNADAAPSSEYAFSKHRSWIAWTERARIRFSDRIEPWQNSDLVIRKALASATREFPDDPQPVLDLGALLETKGEIEEALGFYRDFTARHQSVDVMVAQLAAQVRVGDLPGARAIYEDLHEDLAQAIMTDENARVFLNALVCSGALEARDFDVTDVFFARPFVQNVRSIADVSAAFTDQFGFDYLRTLKRYTDSAGAHLIYVSLDNLFDVQNKTETERQILAEAIWERWQERPTWLKSMPPHIHEVYGQEPGFSQEYIDNIFVGPQHILHATKVALPNYETRYVNIRDNQRVTTDTPDKARNRVLFLGGSDVYGFGCDDASTVPSHLQRRLLGVDPESYRVENHGMRGNPMALCLNNLLQSQVNPGDIAIVFGYPPLPAKAAEEIGILTHHVSFSRPHDHGELFFDQSHVGPKGNAIIADQVAGVIADLPQAPTATADFEDGEIHASLKLLKYLIYRNASDQAEAGELKDYVDYLKEIRVDAAGRIGSVAVNCNPMTLGHLHLLEHAARSVDFLYVFVIEEDQSFFSFKDRLDLVTRGLAHLPNVKVIRGGKFICTQLTFPEYFSKEDVSQVTADASMEAWFFCEYVAKALDISIIFLGNEPTCNVTRQYNAKMAEILPEYGVVCEIIPRIERDGAAISASAVRRYLKQGDFDAISQIVPPVTLDYLRTNHAPANT